MARVTRDREEKRIVDGEIDLFDGFSIEFPEERSRKIREFIEERDLVNTLEIDNYDDLLNDPNYNSKIQDIIMSSEKVSSATKEAFLDL